MAPSGIALTKLWLDYMRSLDTITMAIGRSSNVVGEFAEKIVAHCTAASSCSRAARRQTSNRPTGGASK
jgi:hypothetical protein